MIDGKQVSDQDFKQVKEEVSKDKSKLLKEVTPGNFRTLSKMNG